MTDPAPPAGRTLSFGEELANSVSHGIGLVLALAAAPVLIASAVRDGATPLIVGTCVFAATLVLLYLVSTIYHALPVNRAKRVLRVIDHAAIFLLIAGSYTPFTLGVLHGAWGWTLFGLVWGVCTLGIVFKIVRGVRHPRLSLGLYLAAGWLVLVAVKPMLSLMPLTGIAWIAAGGCLYTAGVAFFVVDERVRYAHLVWHLCVMGGSACHVVAVYGYA
jgi:hemolysin III